jgi:hypothetical protein
VTQVTAESNPRDSLIKKVQRGEISRVDAETEAKRVGLPPLERKPNVSSFDPMLEPWWTLPMAMAWIVWRRPQRVVLYWDEYRLKCWTWRRSLRRDRLLQHSPATLGLLLREERSGEAEVRDDPKIMSVRSAKAALWKRSEKARCMLPASVLIPVVGFRLAILNGAIWNAGKNRAATLSVFVRPPHPGVVRSAKFSAGVRAQLMATSTWSSDEQRS